MINFDEVQRAIYEAFDFLGPLDSALLAGFAVMTWDGASLTAAGERYLAAQEPAS